MSCTKQKPEKKNLSCLAASWSSVRVCFQMSSRRTDRVTNEELYETLCDLSVQIEELQRSVDAIVKHKDNVEAAVSSAQKSAGVLGVVARGLLGNGDGPKSQCRDK